MVLTSPLSSIKGFVSTRPPLVLFTLCLIAFAVTTLSFAYYVEHRNDLPNIDAHKDWVSFLKYLSNRKLCVAPSDGSAPTLVPNNRSGTYATIYVNATLKYGLNMNYSYVQGDVNTRDWISQCPMALPVSDVRLSFKIPHTNSSDADICVAISGPIDLLAPAVNVNQCKSPDIIAHGVFGHLTSGNSLDTDYKFNCTDGLVTTLTFVPSPYNNMLLTLHDRAIIKLHLFHTSYFMLVMAITLICYAMIKGKPNMKLQQFEKINVDT